MVGPSAEGVVYLNNNDFATSTTGTWEAASNDDWSYSSHHPPREKRKVLFSFPKLNGEAIYNEGEEIKGVDLLRMRVARWLGTVKFIDRRNDDYKERILAKWALGGALGSWNRTRE